MSALVGVMVFATQPANALVHRPTICCRAPIWTAPVITSADGTVFTASVSGSFNVTTSGFPTPVLAEGGTLPAGVTFTDNGNGTATLSGTPPKEWVGTYPITITASNGFGPVASQSFTLQVNAVTGIAGTPDGGGYWMVDNKGDVYAFGDAAFYGSLAGDSIANIEGIAATPDGKGYWLVTSTGGVFAFGDALFEGSLGGERVTNIADIASTPDGKGYWMVNSSGAMWSFGDAISLATLYGSPSSLHLNVPFVGMAVAPATQGYWLVTSTGGVFCYGPGAEFEGALGGAGVTDIMSIASTPDGKGYWMVDTWGGVWSFGDAAYHGSV
jgi:hypothetical protein